jgi:plasmid stability protein
MPALQVKNVPGELYSRLKQTAKEHHRSVSGEVLYLIEHGLAAGTTQLYPVPAAGTAPVRVAEAARPDFRPNPGSPFASNRERRKALFEWLKSHPLFEHPENLSDPARLVREDRDSR